MTPAYDPRVATWDDVRRIALTLPESVERPGDTPQWRVRDVLFAWERPLRPKDIAELGAAAPDGPLLAVRVPDEGAKHALVAAEPDVYLTTSHFNGYPAVLVRLDRVAVPELEELLVEAWLTRAPRTLAKAFVAERS